MYGPFQTAYHQPALQIYRCYELKFEASSMMHLKYEVCEVKQSQSETWRLLMAYGTVEEQNPLNGLMEDRSAWMTS